MSDPSATTSSSQTRNVENQFKILVATDIHLGYGEKNQILAEVNICLWIFPRNLHFTFSLQDSFNSFEEILQIANSRQVDFILLGGDLFHDPTPSMFAIHK